MIFAPDASPPEVWAVEDNAVQICWGDLRPGLVTAQAAGATAAVEHLGGPGSLDLNGLPPGRELDIDLSWAGGQMTLSVTTLDPPPGRLLSRFATISDLHLGATHWGALRTMVDHSGHPVPHPYRCASAAIAEARHWGATQLIIKGDTVHHERPADFEQLARLVDEFSDLPMLLIPGNHDVDRKPGAIPSEVGTRRLPFIRSVDHHDLPGVRLVAADTTIAGRGVGSVTDVADPIIDRIKSADRPVFVALHQQLQAGRVPRYWPAGIAAPASTEFLGRLDGQRQPVVVSSGHTHRNRRRTHGSVLITEVASTKDWPGVWAGYAVHEGGIRQVVRRIAAREAMAWTEYSRGALLGLWSRWAPGPRHHRCLTHRWPPAQ